MDKVMTHIPNTPEERTRLRLLIRAFTEEKQICPPISLLQLEELAGEFASAHSMGMACRNWLMVEMHNAIWRETVAQIPMNRRLLLLPKCLSKSGQCEGEYDNLGLLCHRCGRCHIPTLQDRAEELGMISLVAEGFTQVIELIQNNVVDAVIGVSCLDSLEKAFPLLVRHAIPGLALPLNDGGCHDTHVDEDYLLELIEDSRTESLVLLDYNLIESNVSRWFTREAIEAVMSPIEDEGGRIVQDWMSDNGKRWRPFLLTAVYQTLMGPTGQIPEEVHRAAVAIECFHKASLIHDDVQDRDVMRYDRPTLNARYGDAYAINAGDTLLGEGYRLLSECHNPQLLHIVTQAHLDLCKGQGAELMWCRNPELVDMDTVLEIYRWKTASAFQVSLLLGLHCTGNFVQLRRMLCDYSQALGVAYQLKDDLEDFDEERPMPLRPSAVLAILCQQLQSEEERDELIQSKDVRAFLSQAKYQHLTPVVKAEVGTLRDRYYQQALDALRDLDVLELKRLLYYLTEKIMRN